ncbi:hypothetical protein HUJ05_007299 [Dendroctonus ponderosae]|nr:hypothetical protein HUJ05_007299 [Dendroctonus ponderosae]
MLINALGSKKPGWGQTITKVQVFLNRKAHAILRQQFLTSVSKKPDKFGVYQLPIISAWVLICSDDFCHPCKMCINCLWIIYKYERGPVAGPQGRTPAKVLPPSEDFLGTPGELAMQFGQESIHDRDQYSAVIFLLPTCGIEPLDIWADIHCLEEKAAGFMWTVVNRVLFICTIKHRKNVNKSHKIAGFSSGGFQAKTAGFLSVIDENTRL